NSDHVGHVVRHDGLIHRSIRHCVLVVERAGYISRTIFSVWCRRGCRHLTREGRRCRVSTPARRHTSRAKSHGVAGTSAPPSGTYPAAPTSLCNVDAAVDFARVMDTGTDRRARTSRCGARPTAIVTTWPLESRSAPAVLDGSACVLLSDRVKPMERLGLPSMTTGLEIGNRELQHVERSVQERA